MLTTLPLECFVCREVMLNYWFPNEPFNMNLHLIFTTSLVVSAMTMALITCDLGAVFELVGATSACALAYIFPPLCYVKLSKRSWKTYMAIACAVFGSGVMAISLIQVSCSDLVHMADFFTNIFYRPCSKLGGTRAVLRFAANNPIHSSHVQHF